jgi:S-formylglutathione hydrolase FrmB
MRATAALLILTAANAAAEVRTASFPSASLERDVSYVVDLPASYEASETRYPVLYVLHGLFEGPGFWERRGMAPLYRELAGRGEVPELIVVAVDGGNSFFVNGAQGRYEDLLTRDLIAHVDATYRTIARREGRALLGVSMGGYAALRIAFKQPELFGAVSTHSAMLLLKIPTADDGARRGHMAAFQRVFGTPIDSALWTENDPFAWAEKADPKKTPALHFDCGSEDRYGLAAGNQALHELLERRGIRHSFALRPGDHGYEYVRSVLAGSLGFVAKNLAAPEAPVKKPAAKRR